MAVDNEELLTTDHHGTLSTLKDDTKKTQPDHAALNSMQGALDYFDRYSSFSNLITRFTMMGLQSKDGITLSAVEGGGFIWVAIGLVGSLLAVVASIEEHENRKKALEEKLAHAKLILERCEKLSKELGLDDNLTNEELLELIVKGEDVLRKRKTRKLIAGIMGMNPYSVEFEKRLAEYVNEIAKEEDADFDEIDEKTNKLSLKQIISYVVNFIGSFATGSGFVYWGAVIFGVPVPFGWVLMFVGVLVGVIVGTLFVAQQVRADLEHQPLDETIDQFHNSLKLREKLLKRYKKIEKNDLLALPVIDEQAVSKEVIKVEPNLNSIPPERQHLYVKNVPNSRKHLFRAAAISYNTVLGFVIGFGLVMTFAFVTGGAGLIPGIIIGLAMSGYFVYTAADNAVSEEKSEAEKRAYLQQVQVEYESHWANHPSENYSPVNELGKSTPKLLLDMIIAFHKQNIFKDSNQRYQNQNKMLDLLETITKIQLRKDKAISDAFFDELYLYFLENLKNEIPEEETQQWEEVKKAVVLLKQKVLGKYAAPIITPKKPETFIEEIVLWFRKNVTKVTMPKAIRRLFTILGAFTLGAAIPFMTMSGGIALPVFVGLFMAAVLTAYIIREVMEYKKAQAMKDIDEEVQKYEIIDRTRKLNKSENKPVKALENSLTESVSEDAVNDVPKNKLHYGAGQKRGMLKGLQFIGNMQPMLDNLDASMEQQSVASMD